MSKQKYEEEQTSALIVEAGPDNGQEASGPVRQRRAMNPELVCIDRIERLLDEFDDAAVRRILMWFGPRTMTHRPDLGGTSGISQ